MGLEAAEAQRARLLALAAVRADVAFISRLPLFGALSGENGNADNLASARTKPMFGVPIISGAAPAKIAGAGC